MGKMIENKQLLEFYLNTKDEKYLDKLMDNFGEIIVNCIKRVLKEYDMDENDYQQYVSICYIELMEKIKRTNKIYHDEFSLHSSFSKFISGVMVREMEKEKEIRDNNIFFGEIEKDKFLFNELCVYNSFEELKMDYKKRMLLLHDVIERVLNDQERYIIKKTYGINCEVKNIKEIALELNMSMCKVSDIRSKAFRIIRKEIYKSRESNLFDNEKAMVKKTFRK